MAVSSDTLVLTTRDWIAAKDLLPGDYVYGLDGLPTEVLSTQNYTPRKLYSLLLDDGMEILADGHQELALEDNHYRSKLSQYMGRRRNGTMQRNYSRRQKLKIKTVDEALQSEEKFSIPVTAPIAFRHQDLPVNPYIAGLWFGFMARKNTLWLKAPQYKHLEKVFRQNQFKLNKLKADTIKKRYEVVPNIGISFLTDNRFPVIPTSIPKEYLFASPEQRIEFLRGFFIYRRNCYNVKKNVYKVTTQDKKLIKLLRFMCEALGMKTYIVRQPLLEKTFISLFIRTDITLHPDHVPVPNSASYKRRFITSIEEVDPVPCTHIKTNKPFIIGTEGFIAVC